MTKEIKIAPITMGGGKAGALSTAPVSVDEDVYVSADKAYTHRLNIATMNAFEAWCKTRKLGKGPVIVAALREYMARHEEG